MKNISPWFDSVPDQRKFEKLSSNIETDVVVIGGGIVGILTAYKLSKEGLKVVLVEKNHIATGDTGYTTGFLTKIPEKHLQDIEKEYGLKFAKDIYNLGQESQNELFGLIENEKIECDFKHCDTVFGAYEEYSEFMRNEFNSIKKLDSSATQMPSVELSSTPFKSAIKIKNEGQFNSREFIFGLLEKLNDIKIFEETEITAIEVLKDEVIVKSKNAKIKAKRVVAAVGNPSVLFEELSDIVEGKITYVIGAKFKDRVPLDDNLYWDDNTPYFYFRKISDDTLILGGCDISFDKAKTQKPFEILEKYLKDNFKGEYELEYKWSGNIFYSVDELPYAFNHPNFKNKVYVVAGLSGSGLIFGNLMASTIADLIQKRNTNKALMFSLSRTKTHIKRSTFGKLLSKTEPKKEASTILLKTFVKVAKVSDIENNNVFCATIDGKEIAIFKVKSRLYALNNTCTHMGGPLCEGHLEGEVIECPWHGGKFNVTNGEVVSGPPTTPEKNYNVRINGQDVEIEIEVDPKIKRDNKESSEELIVNAANRIDNDKKAQRKDLLLFTACAFAFWFIEFILQYFWLSKSDIQSSLLRSFALTGATLISLALFSSAIFKWFPNTAKHWRTRRHLGVGGFSFIVFHVLSVYYFMYNFNFKVVYYSLNPLENPIVFGSMAFPIFMMMALTSTDWAVRKLTYKWWKFIHRFVYFAYAFSIFHFTQINPDLLNNPAGYFLLLVVFLALFGQLFWFIKTIIERRFKTYGVLVGALIITLYIFLGIKAWNQSWKPYFDRISLEKDTKAMFSYLDENGGNTSDEVQITDQMFKGGVMQRSGKFRELTSPTKGSASLEKKGEVYFVVLSDDFSTPKGADLYIYLTKNTSRTERSDIKNGIELGRLESKNGKQFYSVGEIENVEDYNSVTIHSKVFDVPWSFALLK